MNSSKIWIGVISVLSLIGYSAKAYPFLPLDHCIMDPDPDKQIYYKQFHYHREGVSSVPGQPVSRSVTDTTYAWVGSRVKIIYSYSASTEYGTNTITDGPFLLPEQEELHFLVKYGCNSYEEAELHAPWLNAYLEGQDVSGFAGSGKNVTIEEGHSATGYSATMTITDSDPNDGDGDTGTSTVTWSGSLSGAVTLTKEVNDGKDNGKDCGCNKGMPTWSISEPYLNLWIKDMPVYYSTSLGEEIGFELLYKQRDTRPTDSAVTSVPVTGWQHNWFSYFSYQVPTYLTGTNSSGYALDGLTARGAIKRANWVLTNDLSRWAGTLYGRDGGENYFTYEVMSEPDSGLKLTPINGTDISAGFRLVHPDGTEDIYETTGSLRPVFGEMRFRGLHSVRASGMIGDFDADSIFSEPWATNNYSEFDNSSSAEPPIGNLVGYMAGEALLRYRIDPYGNTITLFYDSNNRLETIRDYDLNETHLYYTNGLLARVEMPYGKTAVLNYTLGKLTSITDAEGNQSSIGYTSYPYIHSISQGTSHYQTNIFVSSLTTPYGPTTFTHTETSYFVTVANPPSLHFTGYTMVTNFIGTTPLYVGRMGGTNRVNRACEVTNPDGSKEVYVYRYDSKGLVRDTYSAGEIPSSGVIDTDDGSGAGGMDTRLATRNTFYWGKRQSALVGTINLASITMGQVALATMSHWLESPNDDGELSDSISLLRAPSPGGTTEGAKTWFGYTDKPSSWKAPTRLGGSAVARMMPNGDVAYQQTYLYSDGLLGTIYESYTHPSGALGERSYTFAYEDATATDPFGGYNYKRLNQITWPDGYLTRTYSTDGLQMDQTDFLGYTSSIFFNSRHQITGVKRASGLTTTNLYGSDHFLSKTIDLESGATNTYNFAYGLLRTNTSPLGLTTSYEWDKLDRLLKVNFQDGTRIQNKYDKLDLVLSIDRLGKTNTAGYGSMRQLLITSDANTNITHYSWCSCGALESVTDPLNHVTTFYRDFVGNVTSVTTDDGFVTTYNRDLFGRVTNVTSTAGLDLDYGYNIQGLLTGVTNPAGTVFSAIYDANDYPLYVTDSRGVTVANTFDAYGRLQTRQNELGYMDTYIYSAQGLREHQDTLYRVTSYGYDPAGRLAAVTNANLEVIQLGYSRASQLASLTDGRNNTKRWVYDSYGRQVYETNAAGVLVKTNGYNANGWLTAQWTPAKGRMLFGYDAVGNLKSIYQPNSGTLTYSYDALNRLTGFTDALGSSVLGYTSFGAFSGALTSENGPWANDTVTYGYTAHLLTNIALGSWSQTIGYDAALRPETFTSPAGTFEYAFNGASRQVDTLTLPQNLVTYGYDDIGALTLKQLKKGGTTLDTHGYTYDPVGLITNIARLNGVYGEYVYDPIGQLVRAQASESGGAPRLNEQFGYGYDAAHNLALRTNNTLIQTFTSNAKDELASIVRAGTLTVSGSVTGGLATLGVNGTRAEVYSDQTFATTNGLTLNNGNNLFVTAGSNSSGALVVSTKTATKLPVTVNTTYDLNGNLVSDGIKGYDYDDANQLIRVTVTNGWRSEFAYDGLGRRRITKDYTWSGASWTLTNEVRYMWDGMAVLQERDGSDAVKVTYTRGLDLSGTMQGAGGIGGLLARTDSNGTTFYHSDGGGNVTTMTDSSGNVVARYLYDPYGNLLAKSGAMADVNKYRFSSKEVHLNSGMYYYGFRFYEPNLQRWVNQDPIREAGGMNLYGFVGNNPLNGVDIFGLEELSWLQRLKLAEEQIKAKLRGEPLLMGGPEVEEALKKNQKLKEDAKEVVNCLNQARPENVVKQAIKGALNNGVDVVSTDAPSDAEKVLDQATDGLIDEAVDDLAASSGKAKESAEKECPPDKKMTREERWQELAESGNLSKEETEHIRRHGGTGMQEVFGKELAHPPKQSNVQGHGYENAVPRTSADHRGIEHRYLKERKTGTTISPPKNPGRTGGKLDVPPEGKLP